MISVFREFIPETEGSAGEVTLSALKCRNTGRLQLGRC